MWNINQHILLEYQYLIKISKVTNTNHCLCMVNIYNIIYCMIHNSQIHKYVIEILHRRQSKNSRPKQVSHLSANRFPSFLLKKTFTGKTRPSCEFSLHFPVKPWWKPPGRAVSLAVVAMARSWECLWQGSVVEAWFEKTVCSEKMWILRRNWWSILIFLGHIFRQIPYQKLGIGISWHAIWWVWKQSVYCPCCWS